MKYIKIFETRSEVYKKISEMMPARNMYDYFLELEDLEADVKIRLGLFYESKDNNGREFLSRKCKYHVFKEKIQYRTGDNPEYGYSIHVHTNSNNYNQLLKYVKNEFLSVLGNRFRNFKIYSYVTDFNKVIHINMIKID